MREEAQKYGKCHEQIKLTTTAEVTGKYVTQKKIRFFINTGNLLHTL